MNRPASPGGIGSPVERDIVEAWPKTDLHCHLDGSIRRRTLIELAREYHVELPSYDETGLTELLGIGQRRKSLEHYIEGFDLTIKAMQERDALTRVAYELVEDAAREHVVYQEVRFSPLFHTSHAMTWSEIVDAVLDGLERGERDFGTRNGLILMGIRSIDPLISSQLAQLTVRYKERGVVGFDLAGAEHANPAREHREAFSIISKHNVNCTLHAGEEEGRRSISEALHYCGADRIGQGTKLRDNADLLNYVNNHRIPLEMCLSSAVQIGSVNDLRNHPFGFYLDFGLRVTLNTDSRLFTGTTITDELLLAATTFGLSLVDLENIVINGFKSAFLPYHEKVSLLTDILPRLGRKVPKHQALRLAQRAATSPPNHRKSEGGPS